jgi:hypothetical protein
MSLSSIVLMLAANATAAPATTPAPADPLEKVKCIREPVTGSLVSTRKVCHTEGEWRRIRNDAESEARRIIQPGTLNERNGG